MDYLQKPVTCSKSLSYILIFYINERVSATRKTRPSVIVYKQDSQNA